MTINPINNHYIHKYYHKPIPKTTLGHPRDDLAIDQALLKSSRKIHQIKQQIKNGNYLTQTKLDIALNNLLNDLLF